MKRDIHVYLADIVECLEKIEEYTQGISEVEFFRNTQIQDAVLRRLEIIGEAVKHLPKRIREKYPSVPWQKVAGTRDILAHEYFGVHLQNVWKIIQEDLTPLKAKILQIKDELPS